MTATYPKNWYDPSKHLKQKYDQDGHEGFDMNVSVLQQGS